MATRLAFGFPLYLLLLAVASNLANVDAAGAQTRPAEFPIANAPLPVRVLIQSPADTETELQIICLFESVPANVLHGSLAEIDEKLKGLLVALRKPDLFRGELGETILIAPPVGGLAARRLLIIGLGIKHPFFAPAILDGGVTKINSGETAESFLSGFLRALRTEKVLVGTSESTGRAVEDLTFLAGPTHATDTQHGLERAVTNSAK
jgi:hypothetical protein